MLSNALVAMSLVPASNLNVNSRLDQGYHTPIHGFEQCLDPKTLGRSAPLWDTGRCISSIIEIENHDENDGRRKEEGSDCHSHINWE